MNIPRASRGHLYIFTASTGVVLILTVKPLATARPQLPFAVGTFIDALVSIGILFNFIVLLLVSTWRRVVCGCRLTYHRENWKAGLQFGAAYFATTEMRPDQRDAATRGPGLNIATGPIGGYFPLTSGPPAVTVGWPFHNLGVNVSTTGRIF